jgi:selenocysteine lyase/cysteine desulfurase
LSLIEELTVEKIGASDTALADRFRAGLGELALTAVSAPGSSIVSIPGAAASADRLRAAGVAVSARSGALRLSFHLYNSTADVDRALEALA